MNKRYYYLKENNKFNILYEAFAYPEHLFLAYIGKYMEQREYSYHIVPYYTPSDFATLADALEYLRLHLAKSFYTEIKEKLVILL